MRNFGKSPADDEIPTFEFDVDAVMHADFVCHLKLASDPLHGDAPSIVERELHIFGTPTSREPILVASAYTAT